MILGEDVEKDSPLFPYLEKLNLPDNVDFVFNVHTTATEPFGEALFRFIDEAILGNQWASILDIQMRRHKLRELYDLK